MPRGDVVATAGGGSASKAAAWAAVSAVVGIWVPTSAGPAGAAFAVKAAAVPVLLWLAWWLGQLGLQWVLVGDHYSAYGVVGAFMGILVWLYYSSAALFLGAELVRLRGQQMREREAAKNPPPM